MAGVPQLEAFAPGEMVEKVLYLAYEGGGGGIKRKVTETGFATGGNSLAPPVREASFNFNMDDWELDRGMSGSSFLLPGSSADHFESPPNAAGSLIPQPLPHLPEVKVFGNSIPATVPNRHHSLALGDRQEGGPLTRCDSLDIETAKQPTVTNDMFPVPVTRGSSDLRKFLMPPQNEPALQPMTRNGSETGNYLHDYNPQRNG